MRSLRDRLMGCVPSESDEPAQNVGYLSLDIGGWLPCGNYLHYAKVGCHWGVTCLSTQYCEQFHDELL